jgi:aminocarboxymuconate-semialdehyde decarboxylase
MSPAPKRPAGRVVDVHCHWFPEALIRLLERDGPRHGIEVKPSPSGDRSLRFIRWFHPPLHPFVDVEHRLAYMDRVGVDTHVLTLSGQVTPIWVEPDFGLAMAQVANDEYAALQQKYPDRFVGVAAVPLQDPRRAIGELERAVSGKGLRGVNLLANIQGKYLDAPEFLPFFERVQELGVPVVVHPTDPGGPAAVDEHALFAHVGYPLDTTVAIARLIFSGALQRFPRIPWIFYHGGGAAPYLRGRWDRGFRSGFPEAPGLSRAPSEYVASLYFDALVYDAETLRFLVRVMGPDHVLMGTDYPYTLMAEEDPVGSVRALRGLAAADRARILGGTAARLFGLTAPSGRGRR